MTYSTVLLMLLTLGLPASSAGAQEGAQGTVSFVPSEAGTLPQGLSRSVANTLTTERVEGRWAITGETDATSRYQLQSRAMSFAPEIRYVRVLIEGRIEHGGLYAAILDDEGLFLGAPQEWSRGLLGNGVLGPVPIQGGKRFRLVLGNSFQEVRSKWVLYRISVIPLSEPGSFSLEFNAQYEGSLPPNLRRAVTNTLRVKQVDGDWVLAGETDSTSRYQLRTPPLGNDREPVLISVQLEGRVLKGGLYFSLLDESSKEFLCPPRVSLTGPIKAAPAIARLEPGQKASVVIGNVAANGSSSWHLERLAIEVLSMGERAELIKQQAEGELLSGSSLLWALRILFSPNSDLSEDREFR